MTTSSPVWADQYSAVSSSSEARASASVTGGSSPASSASAKRRNWPCHSSGRSTHPASAASIAAAASGVSGVIVHGLADDEYGAVFDSAEKAVEVESMAADLLRRAERRGDGGERTVLQLERRRRAVLDLDRVDQRRRSAEDTRRRTGDVREHVERVHALAQEHTAELGRRAAPATAPRSSRLGAATPPRPTTCTR